jgi:tetratricopeptide (TPR) repeat protein
MAEAFMADVSKLYQKAQEYFNRKNFDPAIDLYKQILAMDPNYAPARRDLRKAEVEKFDMEGYPPKFLAQLMNLPSYARLLFLGLSKNQEMYALACEDILARDPKNVSVNLKLGRSLWQAGHTESALAAFEAILDFDGRNLEALTACGDLARAVGNLEDAIGFFQRAQAVDARNKHVNDSIRDISAMISIKPREQASSYRDLVQIEDEDEEDTGPAKSLDEQIADARGEAQANPKDPASWKTLAGLLERKGSLKEAIKALERVVKFTPQDEGSAARLGDMKIDFYDKRISLLEKKLGDQPDDGDMTAKLAEAKKQKTAFEITEYQRRSELYPTDLGLKFTLGGALFRAGKTEEAIAQFQQAKKDPKRAREAGFWLGRCFLQGKKHKLAANQFTGALEQDGTLDFRGKELHYYLAMARLGEGDSEGALKHFETIYEEDIGFKDVAKQIEKLS